MYGSTLSAAFSPLGLQAVRQEMVAKGWRRNLANRQTSRIRHVFEWGVPTKSSPPPPTTRSRRSLASTRARATLESRRRSDPFLSPESWEGSPIPPEWVAGMVRIQLLSGRRPGEVVIMRARDLDTDGGGLGLSSRAAQDGTRRHPARGPRGASVPGGNQRVPQAPPRRAPLQLCRGRA
jgi:integrase